MALHHEVFCFWIEPFHRCGYIVFVMERRNMSKTSKPNRTIEVFVSYAHEDEELWNELSKHLSILKRRNVISVWHDRQIGAV